MGSKERWEKDMEKYRPILDEFYEQQGCTDTESKIDALKKDLESYSLRINANEELISEDAVLCALETHYVCRKRIEKSQSE